MRFPFEGAEDGALPSWGNQMNIRNKEFLGIIKAHQKPRNFITSKIGCDGYWFDNWQDHVAYVGKYMLTKEEKSRLTDDEKNVIVTHMGNR